MNSVLPVAVFCFDCAKREGIGKEPKDTQRKKTPIGRRREKTVFRQVELRIGHCVIVFSFIV